MTGKVFLTALSLRRSPVPSPAWKGPATEFGVRGAEELSQEMVARLWTTPWPEKAGEVAWSPGEGKECVTVGGLRGLASRDARCRL
jgi:hypothetical protein